MASSFLHLESGFFPPRGPEFRPRVVGKSVGFGGDAKKIGVKFSVAVQVVKTTDGINARRQFGTVEVEASGGTDGDDLFDAGFFRLQKIRRGAVDAEVNAPLRVSDIGE